jgi:hypothetical protein
MKRLKYILVVFFLTSCATDDSVNNADVLSEYIENRTIEMGAVIACAGNSSDNTDIVEVYFYPENNAVNYRLYETNTSDLDPNDFSNYKRVTLSDLPLFNGYLRKFPGTFTSERWFVVTFEIDGEVKLSNPIRAKSITQPTLFSNQVEINQEQALMPLFSWDINSEANNAIFFQVLSTIDNDLISGTYTFENQFRYYDTSNVVLNITDGIPPNLISGQDYKFTIMDVSEDNWVNELFILEFTVE